METKKQKSNQNEQRQIPQAERNAMRRAANILQHRGYYVYLAFGEIRETFSLIALPRIQEDPSKDSGIILRIVVEEETISFEELERIRYFKIPQRREIWILVFSTKQKNDPGHFITPIQFNGTEIVQTPENRLFVDILKTMSRAGKAK